MSRAKNQAHSHLRKHGAARKPYTRCTIVHRVEAEWDPAKARANLPKHGVRFADAVAALEDARAISVRDEGADEERG